MNDGEIIPARAPILKSIVISKRENPVKPSVTFRVKNMPNIRFVCQNKGDLHLAYGPPKAFKSRLFLLHTLPIRTLETLPEHQYEGRFFRGLLRNQVLTRNVRAGSQSVPNCFLLFIRLIKPDNYMSWEKL
jgi:hypothetical protein